MNMRIYVQQVLAQLLLAGLLPGIIWTNSGTKAIICDSLCEIADFSSIAGTPSVSLGIGGAALDVSWDQTSQYIAVGTNDNNSEFKVIKYEADPYGVVSLSQVAEADAGRTVQAVEWHPNCVIAVGTRSQNAGSEIQIWNHEVDEYGGSSLVLINTANDDKDVNDVSWSCNGLLAVGLNNSTGMDPIYEIRVFRHTLDEYDIFNSTLENKGNVDLSDQVDSLSWSPASVYTGSYFLAATVANHLHVYQYDDVYCSLSLTASIQVDNNDVGAVRWAPDGQGIAVGGDGLLKLYTFDESNSLLEKVGDQAVSHKVTSLSWTGDGNNLLANQNVAIRIYEKVPENFSMQNGLELVNTIATGAQTLSLDWAPNCRRIATGFNNSTIVEICLLVDNEPPIAQDDVGLTKVNKPVTIDVLANDFDPDMNPLTVIALTQPSNGSAVLNLDDTITYTPNINFFGVDLFTYTISDSYGGTDTARVVVCVFASDIVVTKTVSKAFALEGDIIDFFVKVTNNGPSEAQQVIINDLLPTDVTFVSATPSVGSYDNLLGLWNIGSLLAGTSATLSITVQVNAGTVGKTITNTAVFGDPYQCDIYGDNNMGIASFTVVPQNFVLAGSNVFWKLLAPNGGVCDITVE